MSWLSAIIFFAVIAAIASEKFDRTIVALIGAILVIVLGLIPLDKVLEEMNLDVLGLIAGACVVSAYLAESGLADEAARRALAWSRGDFTKILFALGLVTGVISLFMENVTTLILFAPAVFSLARAAGISPVPLILAMAFASNLGGAALLVGDPQSALAAGYYNLDFMDFIFHNGKPSIFWMVLAGLLTAVTVFAIIEGEKRKDLNYKEVLKKMKGIRDKRLATVVLIALSIKIFLLSIRKQIGIGLAPPAILAATMLSIYAIKYKGVKGVIKYAFEVIEWKLLIFLASMFIIVGSLKYSGVLEAFAKSLEPIVGCNLVLGAAFITLISILVSAVMDNVPYLLAMFPVIDYLSARCGIDVFKYLLALLIGATLGGNITYLGTSTNVAAVHLLEEEGYYIKFKDFVKLGLLYTVAAVLPAWIIYAIFWL